MLGTRIAALRRNAGLSQSQLAQLLKISPSAMGMYEQGRREPSGELLVAIANTLQVTGKADAPGEKASAAGALLNSLADLDKRIPVRSHCFTQQELIVLFAALMMDT